MAELYTFAKINEMKRSENQDLYPILCILDYNSYLGNTKTFSMIKITCAKWKIEIAESNHRKTITV